MHSLCVEFCTDWRVLRKGILTLALLMTYTGISLFSRLFIIITLRNESISGEVPWYNPYRGLTMLDFNPSDGRLYFFDKRRSITSIHSNIIALRIISDCYQWMSVWKKWMILNRKRKIGSDLSHIHPFITLSRIILTDLFFALNNIS